MKLSEFGGFIGEYAFFCLRRFFTPTLEGELVDRRIVKFIKFIKFLTQTNPNNLIFSAMPISRLAGTGFSLRSNLILRRAQHRRLTSDILLMPH
jgi:hypothetical protein